jgi:hypothetical protein
MKGIAKKQKAARKGAASKKISEALISARETLSLYPCEQCSP